MSILPYKHVSLREALSLDTKISEEPKALQNRLDNYKGVVILAKEAIESYLKGVYPDPLVGENACQIRAVLYCQLAQDPTSIKDLTETVCKLDKMIGEGKDKGTLDSIKLPKKKQSLSEVLEENKADIDIPETLKDKICWILYGHILTVTKDSKIDIDKNSLSLIEALDYKKLPSKVSSSFSKQLIKDSRKKISALSIEYLKKELESLPADDMTSNLLTVVKEQVLVDDLEIQTVPMLPATMILLQALKAHNISIILRNRVIENGNEKDAKSIRILYSPTGKDKQYEVVKDLSSIDKARPVVVLEAVSLTDKPSDLKTIEASIHKIGVETILLAACAAHNQYGGTHKSMVPTPIKEIDEIRTSLTDLANKEGLSKENSEVCRIYHIYAGTIGSHLIGG